jgi:hypothetical protein
MSLKITENRLCLELGPPGKTAVVCRLACPVFTGRNSGRINRYAARFQAVLKRFCTERILPRALKRLEKGLNPLTIVMSYKIFTNNDSVLSFCFDVACGRNMPLRYASSWSLADTSPLPLSAFTDESVIALRSNVITAIEKRISSGYRIYFKDYKKLVRQRLDRDNFYIDGDKAVLFFQPGTIAPSVEGLQTFPIKAKEYKPPVNKRISLPALLKP